MVPVVGQSWLGLAEVIAACRSLVLAALGQIAAVGSWCWQVERGSLARAAPHIVAMSVSQSDLVGPTGVRAPDSQCSASQKAVHIVAEVEHIAAEAGHIVAEAGHK